MKVFIEKILWGAGPRVIGKDRQLLKGVSELTPQTIEDIMYSIEQEMKDAEFMILKDGRDKNKISFVNMSHVQEVEFNIVVREEK
ncbi:unnamed protein product [Bacillus phage SPP1]|uniref:B.subtilis phage SPP1 DNA sequence coding for products required for replication initiation n=1 Tax=Bacillus phage SPP1 TaxID=10724 RepID=Q38141_BPSPP|nr:hypothetical protein SPP1p074 [Bacillus phage SPP1]CAA48052.1 unnamed protein product [Bacillus phage SPP1]CAA66540.1 unnamed protein product [Bacillus phage SPP1]prf//2018369D PRF 34.3 [Bacillus phage SPP1]